jgi:hypothetical protein
MVEITPPLVLQIIQTVSLVVGIIYYLIIMRNSQRTQQQTLDARRTDTFLRHWGTDNEEHIKATMEMMQQWEWTDYADWVERYSTSPEMWSKFASNMQRYNGLGLLAMRDQVDLDLIYQYTPAPIISLWEKFGEVIIESRGDPDKLQSDEHYEGFEFLYNEMIKRRKKQEKST